MQIILIVLKSFKDFITGDGILIQRCSNLRRPSVRKLGELILLRNSFWWRRTRVVQVVLERDRLCLFFLRFFYFLYRFRWCRWLQSENYIYVMEKGYFCISQWIVIISTYKLTNKIVRLNIFYSLFSGHLSLHTDKLSFRSGWSTETTHRCNITCLCWCKSI